MQRVRGMSENVLVLMNRASLHRHVAPERGKRLLEPWRAIDNGKFRRLQAAIGEIDDLT